MERGIWSIILAAGESRRMGFPKMLLRFNGMTMIEKVMENVSRSACDEMIVVLGAYREELIEIVTRHKKRYCCNDNYREGMLSSVKCGFMNLPDNFEAVLVFQGDQPFISPDVTNRLIDAFRSSGKGIVIPVCMGKRGHPLLLSSRYRGVVENLNDGEGLRQVSFLFPEDVLEVNTDDVGILKDFDTFEDYRDEFNK